MTTSPDESRPAGVSAIIVPDVLRPRIDEFLYTLGLTVQPFPFDGPVAMVIAIPEEERKSLSDTIDLGRSTSPGEADASRMWTPVSREPGLRPLPDPRALPAYRHREHSQSDRHVCTRCFHPHDEHDGYAYRPPLGFVRYADTVVVICGATGCACLTRIEPPTPV